MTSFFPWPGFLVWLLDTLAEWLLVREILWLFLPEGDEDDAIMSGSRSTLSLGKWARGEKFSFCCLGPLWFWWWLGLIFRFLAPEARLLLQLLLATDIQLGQRTSERMKRKDADKERGPVKRGPSPVHSLTRTGRGPTEKSRKIHEVLGRFEEFAGTTQSRL